MRSTIGYSQSIKRAPCKFEGCLEIHFHDWNTTQNCFIICFHSIPILLLLGGVYWITIGVLYPKTTMNKIIQGFCYTKKTKFNEYSVWLYFKY